MSHIEAVQKWLTDNNYDVGYISNPKNIQYFTDFSSDPVERVLALFVFQNKDPFLFAPALEVEAIKDTGWPYSVYGYLDHENPFAIIAAKIRERVSNPKRWALEKGDLNVTRYETLRNLFTSSDFSGDLTPFIQNEQLIKTPAEIKKLEIAGKWADFAFQIGFDSLRTSRTEQDIVAEIEYALKKKGITHTSFDTIVQSGTNAAEPHGFPKPDKIKENALVLFDLGVVYQGYISDASRTIAFGEVNEKAREIYKVCLEAQLTAQSAAKPGVVAEDLDKIARDIITKAGYGDYFIHRLGHGMGQSEHEFPSIMEGNKMELQPGMCFSIEPGIYIPGVAGVRIEDCVHITADGCAPFTHTPKELQTIPVRQ